MKNLLPSTFEQGESTVRLPAKPVSMGAGLPLVPTTCTELPHVGGESSRVI